MPLTDQRRAQYNPTGGMYRKKSSNGQLVGNILTAVGASNGGGTTVEATPDVTGPIAAEVPYTNPYFDARELRMPANAGADTMMQIGDGINTANGGRSLLGRGRGSLGSSGINEGYLDKVQEMGLGLEDYKNKQQFLTGEEEIRGGIKNRLAMEQQKSLDDYQLSVIAQQNFAKSTGVAPADAPELFAQWVVENPTKAYQVQQSKQEADIAANKASVGKDVEAERTRKLTERYRVPTELGKARAGLRLQPYKEAADLSDAKSKPYQNFLGLQKDSRSNLPDGSLLQTDLNDGTLSRIQFPSEEENAMRALEDLPPLGMRSSPFNTKPGIKLSSGLEIPAKDTSSQQLFNNIIGRNLGQSTSNLGQSSFATPAPSTPTLGNSGGSPSRGGMLGAIGASLGAQPTAQSVAPTQVTNQLPPPAETGPTIEWWKLKRDLEQVPVLNSIIRNWTNAYGK